MKAKSNIIPAVEFMVNHSTTMPMEKDIRVKNSFTSGSILML